MAQQFNSMFQHLYTKFGETEWHPHLSWLEGEFYGKKSGTGRPALSWEDCQKATEAEAMRTLLPQALKSGHEDDYFMILTTLVPELLEWYHLNEDLIL